jgi:localization factor PodJL
MRPGVPWSVKGIEDEARQAAKLAARKAGMTLGEWLNTMILDSSEREEAPATSGGSARDLQQSQNVRSDRSATRSDREHGKQDSEIAARLDSLADQLSSLTSPRQNTAVSRFLEPARPNHSESDQLRALIDRVEASERASREALGRFDARIEMVVEKLNNAQGTGGAMPKRPEDVPGFSALETAMRNIVDHIESSETATRQTLKSLQHRISDMTDQAAKAASRELNQNAPALSNLEQRINDLSARLEKTRSDTSRELQHYVQGQVGQLSERIDAVRHSTDAVIGQAQAIATQVAQNEGRQLEERLKSIINELQGAQEPDPDVARLYAEIESLNARFNEIANHDQPAVRRMEDNLAALAQRLDQLDSASLAPQLSDLEHRIQAMDAQLRDVMDQPGDPRSAGKLADKIASVSERLTATESKLDHLGTIERAIEQLYKSMEESRDWVRQTADDAAQRVSEQLATGGASPSPGAASPELQALESGLMAVKASAEEADQRTQETLAAVHDTLEQIITKLAEIDQQAAVQPTQPEPVQPQQKHAPPVDFQQPAAAMPDTSLDGRPLEHDGTDPFATDAMPAPVPEQPVVPDLHDAGTRFDLDGADDEPIHLQTEPVPQQPVPEQMPPATEQPVPETPDMAQPQAPQDPQPEASQEVREDFIAAARRAAQNASSQKGSILGGLGSLTGHRPDSSSDGVDDTQGRKKSRFSLPFLNRARDDDDGLATAQQAIADSDQDADHKKRRRRHLILAGLVLLAAVSAYALTGAGKKIFGEAPQPVQTSKVSQKQSAEPGIQAASRLADPAATARTDLQPTAKPRPPVEQVSTSVDQPAEAPPPLAAVPSEQVEAASPSSGSEPEVATASLATPAEATAETSLAASLPEKLGSQALREAAAAGERNAQFVIASRYLDGKTIEQDFAKAADWYRKAAEQELAPAQYRLGTLFERGRGVEKNLETARQWYERAAEQNNVKAMHNLAVIYANNDNGTAQFDKAAKWFNAAAEHGLKDSLYNLAVLYERGLGVKQDTKEAYVWYGIAARHGDADAKAKSESLQAFFTTEQKKTLDAKVAAWAPKKPDQIGNFVAITDPSWQVETPGSQSASQDFSSLSEQELVLKAQQLLSAMGYDVGDIDGVMGSRTANAVRLFQLQTGIEVNGTVTPDLVSKLAARSS